VQYDPVHAALPWAGVRFILLVRSTLPCFYSRVACLYNPASIPHPEQDDLHPFYCGGCDVHHPGPLWLQLSHMRIGVFVLAAPSEDGTTGASDDRVFHLAYIPCAICGQNLPLESLGSPQLP